MSWELKSVEENNMQLPVLLQDGWEPFAIVNKITAGQASPIARPGVPPMVAMHSSTFVYLKRQVTEVSSMENNIK